MGTTRQRRRRGNRIAQHEGRTPLPDVPTGDRNRAATERARAEVTPTTAAQIPTSLRREHEGRVNQPGVIGKRRFGRALYLPQSPLSGLGLGLEDSINPTIAGQQAYESGAPLTPTQRGYIHGIYGKPTLDAVEHLRAQGRDEALKEPADLTNAVLALSGIGDLAAIAGKGAADVAADAAAGGAAREATGAASEKAASNAVRDAFAKVGAKRAAAADAVKQAVRDAEPDAVKAAREKGQQAAHAFADRVPTPVKVAGKAGARVASYPIRHPILSPIALQIPTAAIHRNPGALEAGFTGEGNYAGLLNAVGNALSPIPLAKEAITLPSTVIPSIYLTGKAAYNAANGNSAELQNLLDQWRQTGLLPHLAEGDTKGALEALEHHPLYSGLEASGALNAAGRVAGAGLRAVPGVHVADVGPRPDVEIPGSRVAVDRGNYSRDVLRNLAQRAFDNSKWAQPKPGTHRATHFAKEAASRAAADAERTRRTHSRERLLELKKALPKKGLRRIDRKSAEVVHLAVERILRDPSSFTDDAAAYKELIDRAAEETRDGKPRLNKAQLKRNRDISKALGRVVKAEKNGHLAVRTVESADKFIAIQHEILDELVDLKLITPERAAKASAIPYARIYMDAGYGVSHEDAAHIEDLRGELKGLELENASPEDRAKIQEIKRLHGNEQLLDSEGHPLSTEAIHTHMAASHIEPPGFLSHKAPTAGDFYRPSFGGSGLDKGARSGESVLAGMHQGGVEALVRQLRRSQGLVDRARAWHDQMSQFGIEVPNVETWDDAKRVIEDPTHFGFPEGTRLAAVPRYPFASTADEIEGALQHQDPVSIEEAAGQHLADQITHPETIKPGQYLFVDRKAAEILRQDAEGSGTGLKAIQAATNVFKRAVLPFSVSFYIGNVFDNYMRTIMGGATPLDFYAGVKGKRALSTERLEQVKPGAHYSSVDELAPHRGVQNVVTGGNKLAQSVRDAAEWSHKHGAAQAAVKFLPQVVGRLSHYLLATNALLSESLPSYGILGKQIRQDIRATQGSWLKSVRLTDDIVKDWAKGVDDPAKRVRLQKNLEQTLGNYTQMSPEARRVLSNVVPFWTWMRAAYKYVYVTMPAHRSIQTGFLAAAAAADQVEREQYGLEKYGKEPLPGWLQGSIPLANGGVVPTANYNSFGYASEPLEAASKASFAQFSSVLEALKGQQYNGKPIEGEENRLIAALWGLGTSGLPGVNDLFEQEGGHVTFHPHVSVPHSYDKSFVQYLREPKETITVPKEQESESGFGHFEGSAGQSFGESWGDRAEASSGASFAEAWANR